MSMERKLVSQGRNALTVTLPAKWLQARGLVAGDTVQLAPTNDTVIVHVGQRSAFRETELDLRDADLSQLKFGVLQAYIAGYDRIVILHANKKARNMFEDQFIGFVVESSSASKLILKNIIQTPEDDFDSLIRRTGHMLSQLAERLSDYVRKEASATEVDREEYILDKTIFYCMRYLHKYGSADNSYDNFVLCATMEAVGDQISELVKCNITKKDAAFVKDCTDIFIDCVFRKDAKGLITKLKKKRKELGQKRFVDGLLYAYVEHLYNFASYMN